MARSITTCAAAKVSLSPSPVMLLTPLSGAAAMTSWPPWRRMATVFEPIRPVPPMTTIFMGLTSYVDEWRPQRVRIQVRKMSDEHKATAEKTKHRDIPG
ncbi:MAG TPA: hypothetical protein VJY34_22820 [Roseiarcus sp.]|nr:hypothetical protein [Roseiarcus sp.]